MKKIYIAGPGVFEPNAVEIGQRYKALCEKYGFIGLYPFDNAVDLNQPKQKIASDIFEANKKMIQECDIVVANLNPFRGKESDSGTVWECGFAYGLGKEVYGYIGYEGEYIDLFSQNEKTNKEGIFYDKDARVIEDFANPLNLMIACSVKKIFRGDFEKVLKGIVA